MPIPANLDRGDVVRTYLDVVAVRDDPDMAPKARRELDRIAYRLRMLWAKWHGDDSLNALASAGFLESSPEGRYAAASHPVIRFETRADELPV